MASLVNAALCAIVAAAFWSLLGYALARHVLPRGLAIGLAPVLGWAAHSAIALPIFSFIGFSAATVITVDVLCIVAAGASMALCAANSEGADAPRVPAWAYTAAALLALAPAAAILPKFGSDGVHLAIPIFDHSKIAIVDAIMRQGLPPIDPVFGGHGVPDRLAYYYLWHFSAAELALPLGASGWEADAGLTWFTAFASLSLMMALTVWLADDSRAAILVVTLAAAGSLRTSLAWLVGARGLAPLVAPPIGFSGWLYQSAWVPQHLMAASCVLLAMLLVGRYARQPSLPLLFTLVLTVDAGFESSTYVGGITLAIAALAAGPVLLASVDRSRRARFIGGMAIAIVLVALLVAPFISEQLAAVAARHDAMPLVVHPFEVLGQILPPRLRRILDLPAYWLVELPIQLPASYAAGAIALPALLRAMKSPDKRITVAGLACLAGAGLVASWLLRSTLGDVNDLALRAVLPAAMILIVFAATAMLYLSRPLLIGALALGGLLLSLPNAAHLVGGDIGGRRVGDADVFAQSPELWAAVRRYASPTDRVANNPLFLQDLTPWPVNISWALLSNRSSCFAGRELALAFAPLPPARRETINKQFIRIFKGEATADDVPEMAMKYGCDVAVVVPQDGAWDHDPFAASPLYRLAETRPGRWRIYLRATR